MFLPLDRKLDWHNPPYITLALIAINMLIFIIYQTNDTDKFNNAYNYYMNSTLYEYELPAYINYLKNNSQTDKANKINSVLQNKNKPHNLQLIIINMLADGNFKKALEQNHIIKPDNKNYKHWKQLHEQFDFKLNHITGYRYALFASEPEFLDFFTYQFLHADWSHLIGNMIFLFIFGFVLESALARPIYIASYLFAGVGSGLFYIYLDPNNASASIGASGSISGLVGMYTVIFAFRKIKFFYYLLVYFNYVKAPAIILLPLWLLYDLSLQLWGPSNVNNLAHIGGLLSGALIAFLIKHFTNLINIDYVNESDDSNKYLSDYNKALDLVSKLEFEKASLIFQNLYAANPNDVNVQFQLYTISKHNPTSEMFHVQARNLLSITKSDQESIKNLYTIYLEYTQLASPPRLDEDILFQLASKFIESRYSEEAENIILLLLEQRPDYEKIAAGLALLIKHYKHEKNTAKVTFYFEILKNKYSESYEAKQTVI